MSKHNLSHDFPPLEYLHIVGYFRSTVPTPVRMVRDTIRCLEAAFPNSIGFGTDEHACVAATRGDQPPHKALPHWKRDSSLSLLANRGAPDSYDLRDLSGDVRRMLDDPVVFDETIDLEWLFVIQEGRGFPQYRMMHHIWQVSYETERDLPIQQLDCMCMCSVRTDLFPAYVDPDDDSRWVSVRFADAVIETWAAHGDLYYALMDATYFREDCAGMCYGRSGPSNCSSLQFRIQHQLWEEARESRREKVRGVYACQFLSPAHIDKLGGRRVFDELLEMRSPATKLIKDLGDKGLIVRLAPTPIDASSRGMNVGFHDTGAWAYKQFRKAGLLL